MFSKKGEIKLLYNIIIIVFFSSIFIFFIFYITSLSNLSIDDKKVKSQIISKQLVRSCFSEEYGKIEAQRFNLDTLNECFNGIDENSLFRIKISEEAEIIYINNKKEEFKQRGQLCSLSQKSSQECIQFVFPIIYIENDGTQDTRFLTIDMIIS